MRRVVMGRTAEGTTVSAEYEITDGVRMPGLPGVVLAELWGAVSIPELPISIARMSRDLNHLPVPGATSFRVVHIDPGGCIPMDATNTIDYLVVLSGEISLQPEKGADFLLRAGDFVIQLGGRHSWRNDSANVCVIVAVIQGAQAATAVNLN